MSDIANLAPALVKAQAAMQAIGKDATNPHFKNKYASLDTIIETIRPILGEHGLALTQTAEAVADGKALVVLSTLVHLSGETLTSSAYVPLAKQDAQGAGGALTYGRRYSLSALLCLATEEDDDGNAAVRPPRAQQQARAPRPAPVAASPAPSQEIPKWLGLAKDRPMPLGKHKGQILGEIETDALKQAEQWCKNQSDPNAKDLLKDIKTVLLERALGDNAVAILRAADAKDDAELPFVTK